MQILIYYVLMVEVAKFFKGLLEKNRDIQRNIIPQPRSPEVTTYSPWEAPTLGIAVRRLEKNIGAIDTAIRTSRGDIAREKLRRNSDEVYVNPYGTVTKHSSEMLISELRETSDVTLDDLHELLSLQGGDLNIDSSYASITAGLSKAYFEANPNDERIDFDKIPENFKHYAKNAKVHSSLENVDRSQVKLLEKDAIATHQEAYFRNNLGMVVDAINQNRMVHPLGRATLSNYLKQETKYWKSQALDLDSSLAELEVPSISSEEVQKQLDASEMLHSDISESTTELLSASRYYSLQSKSEVAKKNADLYGKFEAKAMATLKQDYRPQPGTESETAGYHPYRPPRYVDGVRVKYVDGRPLPINYDSETGQYTPRTPEPGIESETSAY